MPSLPQGLLAPLQDLKIWGQARFQLPGVLLADALSGTEPAGCASRLRSKQWKQPDFLEAHEYHSSQMMYVCVEVCFQEGCGLISEQSEAVGAFAEPTVCLAFWQVVWEVVEVKWRQIQDENTWSSWKAETKPGSVAWLVSQVLNTHPLGIPLFCVIDKGSWKRGF